MPFFGTSESGHDLTQNTQLTSLNQRLSVIEAYNAGNRLGILEAINTASRLSALETLGEQLSIPTIANLTLNNGLSPIALAEVLIGAYWTTAANFTATSLSVWVTQQGTGPLKLALYEKTNNNLLARIAQSVERTSVPVGIQTFELTSKVPVETGKTYYICFYAPYGNNYKFGVETTITNGQLFDGNSFSYANGFPDSISGLYFQTNNKIAATVIGSESLKSAFLALRDSSPPEPSIEPLIDEIEAEIASAIAAHKQESEPHGQYVLDIELLAHIQATNPHQVTLQQLGGEPSGAESRSKTYTDTQIQAVNAWISKLEKLYPAHLVHFWGYGRSFNGATLKSFEYQTQTGYDYYRWASVASPALGDTVEVDVVLRPGSYRLRVIHDKASDRGIVSFYINGAFLGSIDCYASAKTNVNRVDYAFETTTVRNSIVRVIVSGKNAASSGYRYGATALFVYPNISTPPYQLINAGDFTPYFGSDGRQWQTDKNFSGGNSFDLEANVGAFTVVGTTDQRLYKFERSIDAATFTYTIPLTAGLYCVKLHFAENYHSGAGLRVGSVSVNGAVVLSAFDIFVQAGGKHRALIKQFDNINITTNLIITFTNTLINAIEIIRL